MVNVLLSLSIGLFAVSQEAPPAPWKTDAKAARESALQGGRLCVMILFADSF